MSLLVFNIKFLSLRPRIIEMQDKLVIKNDLLTNLLILFAYLRKTEICSGDKIVKFKKGRLFFFRKIKVIPFSELEYIDYSYDSIGTSWIAPFIRKDQLEKFTIFLVTKDEKKHNVCAFLGEGYSFTGFLGVLAGDSVIDFSGTQENDSFQFVSNLSERVGIPIGKPSYVSKKGITCPSCGHRTTKYSHKCLYCGSEINDSS